MPRRTRLRPFSTLTLLVKDHHDGYITWEEFEHNQRVIANNAMSKGSAVVKGAVRKGEVLRADPLWPLRPQAARALQQQHRPLHVLRRAREPRHATVHVDTLSAGL